MSKYLFTTVWRITFLCEQKTVIIVPLVKGFAREVPKKLYKALEIFGFPSDNNIQMYEAPLLNTCNVLWKVLNIR